MELVLDLDFEVLELELELALALSTACSKTPEPYAMLNARGGNLLSSARQALGEVIFFHTRTYQYYQ